MAKPPKQKAATLRTSVSESQVQSAQKNKDKGKKKENKKTTPVVLEPLPVVELSEDEDYKELKSGEYDPDDDGEVGSYSDENGKGDSEDEGVDQEGMERLMKILGEDGLDDFDRAQLEGLIGDNEGGEDDIEDSEGGDEEGEEGEEILSEEDEAEGESGSDEEDDKADRGEEDAKGAEENDDAIPLDEVESVDDDAVPRQKLEVDNQIALERIRQTIQLDPSLPWTETLTVTFPEKIEVDVDDDLSRELAFYKQALHGAQTARTLALKHDFSFTRPPDYFAEMVKSDVHMERIRQRLLDESASIKKSEEKRKQREGKKFGKQVQIEKLKEREKSKKDMDERLKSLKRKRKDILDNAQDNDDGFDVAVEDAISDRPSKRGKLSEGAKGPRMSRSARDKKFGFGGGGRRSKQNTRNSTDSFGPSAGRGKPSKGRAMGGNKSGKKQRPGKSKRMAARTK